VFKFLYDVIIEVEDSLRRGWQAMMRCLMSTTELNWPPIEQIAWSCLFYVLC